MPKNHPESSLDLTVFSKSLFAEDSHFDLNKNPNEEKHFEPTPNSFYGFSIDVKNIWEGWTIDNRFINNAPEIIDVDYIDVTNQKLISDAL